MLNNYSSVKKQNSINYYTLSKNSTMHTEITFDEAFDSVPIVDITMIRQNYPDSFYDDYTGYNVTDVTNTGFSMVILNNIDATLQIAFVWEAYVIK